MKVLAERIGRFGSIRFDEFVAAALYHPEVGFFSSLGDGGRGRAGRAGGDAGAAAGAGLVINPGVGGPARRRLEADRPFRTGVLATAAHHPLDSEAGRRNAGAERPGGRIAVEDGLGTGVGAGAAEAAFAACEVDFGIAAVARTQDRLRAGLGTGAAAGTEPGEIIGTRPGRMDRRGIG